MREGDIYVVLSCFLKSCEESGRFSEFRSQQSGRFCLFRSQQLGGFVSLEVSSLEGFVSQKLAVREVLLV